jgi:hypothetical protein
VAFSVAVLTCLVAVAGWCAITRSRLSAWCLLILSALWLPSNNRHLEGHTLLVLTPAHAITQGDAVGVICWLLATSVLLVRAQASAPRTQRWARAAVTFATCALVLALGALTAYETG